jgi:hypothetical protein
VPFLLIVAFEGGGFEEFGFEVFAFGGESLATRGSSRSKGTTS